MTEFIQIAGLVVFGALAFVAALCVGFAIGAKVAQILIPLVLGV